MRPRMNLPSESRLNHSPALRSRHGPGGRAAHTSPGTAHTAIPRSELAEHSSEPTLRRSAAPGFATTAPEKIPSPQCPWLCPLPSLLNAGSSEPPPFPGVQLLTHVLGM